MSFQKSGKIFQKACPDEPRDSRDTAKMELGLCLSPLLPASCHLQNSLGSQSAEARAVSKQEGAAPLPLSSVR